MVELTIHVRGKIRIYNILKIPKKNHVQNFFIFYHLRSSIKLLAWHQLFSCPIKKKIIFS